MVQAAVAAGLMVAHQVQILEALVDLVEAAAELTHLPQVVQLAAVAESGVGVAEHHLAVSAVQVELEVSAVAAGPIAQLEALAS